MFTQSTPSILFTHRFPQQGFRLVELPPELADLLSSKDAPTLELKSSPTADSQTTTSNSNSNTDPNAPEYVNLCTPSQTYRVRQVQSSNSLHLIRPSKGGIQKQDLGIVGATQDQIDNELNLIDSVTSIAKCGSTLELYASPEGSSAVPFLRAMLRTYVHGEEQPTVRRDGDESMSVEMGFAERNGVLERLFADVPVSRAQCVRGWVEVCAFILPCVSNDDTRFLCWQPLAAMRLQVWKRVVEGAVLQGIDLGKQFLVEDLWRSVLDDGLEEPFPRPLFEAIVRRVCESGGGRLDQLFAAGGMKWASIDKIACLRWVGETYLEATAPSPRSAISTSDFLNAWKDYVPEPWREDVSLSELSEQTYMHPEPKTICFDTEDDKQKVKKNPAIDTSATTAAKKTRNWHELFKNQKRQKR